MEMTVSHDASAIPATAQRRRAWRTNPAVDLVCLVVSAMLSYLFVVAVSKAAGGLYVDFATLLADRALPFVGGVAAAGLYLYSKGHYAMRMPFWEDAKAVTYACLTGLLCEVFLIYANKIDVSRVSTFVTWMIAPVLVMSARGFARALLSASGRSMDRAVVFGRSDMAARAVDMFASDPHLGVSIVSSTDDFDAQAAVALVRSAGATEAVVAMSGGDEAEVVLVSELRRAGIDVAVIPPSLGMSASMNVQYVIGMDAVMLVSRPQVAPLTTRAAKRLFDVVIASAALAVLAVPMAVVAAVVALDGGSAFFAHPRIGRHGRVFRCLKFRSMGTDSAERLARLLESDPAAREEWERDRKLVNDPRITRIGHMIRKTSLDELPQLFNVLAGSMSLIGPRPVTASEMEKYGDAAAHYLEVRPGLTGLWQVSGRNDISYERRVELDVWYVENWSAWHDMAILWKTIPILLGRKGAY